MAGKICSDLAKDVQSSKSVNVSLRDIGERKLCPCSVLVMVEKRNSCMRHSPLTAESRNHDLIRIQDPRDVILLLFHLQLTGSL